MEETEVSLVRPNSPQEMFSSMGGGKQKRKISTKVHMITLHDSTVHYITLIGQPNLLVCSDELNCGSILNRRAGTVAARVVKNT